MSWGPGSCWGGGCFWSRLGLCRGWRPGLGQKEAWGTEDGVEGAQGPPLCPPARLMPPTICPTSCRKYPSGQGNFAKPDFLQPVLWNPWMSVILSPNIKSCYNIAVAFAHDTCHLPTPSARFSSTPASVHRPRGSGEGGVQDREDERASCLAPAPECGAAAYGVLSRQPLRCASPAADEETEAVLGEGVDVPL